MFKLSHYLLVSLLIFPLLVSAAVEDDVAAATQAWANAYNSHVVDNVLARYHEEAVFWGTGSPTIRDNHDLIRVYFSGLPDRPNAQVEIADSRVRVFGDIALNSGIYIFTDDRDGNAISRPARFSFAYRLVDDMWMIIDHHSSASPGG